MALDFGKLIHDQVPDKNGHTLPHDLAGGTYRLLDLNDNLLGSLYEGKVIVDKTYGHAAYTCMICCGPNNPYMLYAPLSLSVNSSQGQVIQARNSCSNQVVNVTGDFPTWWTDNTSIATASGHQINGVAPGSTNHNAQSINMYWGPREDSGGGECPLSQEEPSASTDVLVPDHLVVMTDINGVLASCPTVEGRQITFAVVNSQDLPVPNTPIQENFVSLSQNTCGNGQPIPSPCVPTDSNGQFTDTITVNCGGANGPAHCGYNITDHWEWCALGQAPVNLGTLTEIVHIDAITVNGNTTPNHFQTGYHIYP